MQLSLDYGTQTIKFEVEFRKRKTMAITIEPPGMIKVIAPKGTKEEVILEKVTNKAPWIIKKLYYFKYIKHQKIRKEFVNGESFMYLGRNYSLQLHIKEDLKNPIIKLYLGKFVVYTPTKDEVIIRKAMEEWYRRKALQQIKERVEYYQHRVGVKPNKVTVKEQKKRWGSCSSKGNLNFNWRAVMASSNVLDYIVVHEMCHLVHLNHSKDFWDMVQSILPDYGTRREWLKKNGVRLSL